MPNVQVARYSKERPRPYISASRLERSVDPQATDISNEPTHFATGYWEEAVLLQFDLDFLLYGAKRG